MTDIPRHQMGPRSWKSWLVCAGDLGPAASTQQFPCLRKGGLPHHQTWGLPPAGQRDGCWPLLPTETVPQQNKAQSTDGARHMANAMNDWFSSLLLPQLPSVSGRLRIERQLK